MKKKYDVIALGARDYYEVAVALEEVGQLGLLITDYYRPDILKSFTQKRANRHLPSKRTLSLLPFALMLRIFRGPKFNGIRKYWVDNAFGFVCGAINYIRGNSALVYSYYLQGFFCFYDFVGKRPKNVVCFQVHPTAWFINELINRDLLRFSRLKDCKFVPDIEEEISADEQLKYLRAINRCDGIICASTVSAESLMRPELKSVPYSIVPYGSKLDDSLKVKVLNGPCENRRIRIISVCQVVQRKGLHWAFMAMSMLSPDMQDKFEWTVVASKIDPEIKKLAPSNVTFKANLTDSQLAHEMGSADLFLMPSIIEGFGLVYIESMSVGTPIVYTKNTGAHDICENRVHGFCVDISSLDSIVEIFKEILAAPNILIEMRTEVESRSQMINWRNFRQGIVSALNKY